MESPWRVVAHTALPEIGTFLASRPLEVPGLLHTGGEALPGVESPTRLRALGLRSLGVTGEGLDLEELYGATSSDAASARRSFSAQRQKRAGAAPTSST